MAKLDQLQKKAQEHLKPDEEILAAVLGAYGPKVLGQDDLRNGILMATDRRVIFCAKKLGGYDLEVFPYRDIYSIEMTKGMVMGHKIAFFAYGNKVSMKRIYIGDIKGLVATVKERMESGDSTAAPTPTPHDSPTGGLR